MVVGNQMSTYKIKNLGQALVAHTFDPSARGRGRWTSASSGPAWSKLQVVAQRNLVSKKSKSKTKTKDERKILRILSSYPAQKSTFYEPKTFSQDSGRIRGKHMGNTTVYEHRLSE